MNASRNLLTSANVSRAISKCLQAPAVSAGLRSTSCLGLNAFRTFSTSRRSQIEVFESKRDLPHIERTPVAWPHPETTEKQLNSIAIDHRETRDWSDKVALNMVKVMRWWTDKLTGYRHDDTKPYVMNANKWFTRFIFLETVAAVPGMVAGMLRHFRSLRLMKRDNGWIETMLEDAFNERMHLLTFMTMAQPGWFMKMMILAAQGVFANGFFVAYMVAPSICHRFVGYLEEEAVKTYTLAIQDLDAGRIPAWNQLEAPEIAISYWKMPEGKRSMRDLLLYVRADEAKHREIHHTMGNLNWKEDPNPYVSIPRDPSLPHPEKGFAHLRSKGWEREEVI